MTELTDHAKTILRAIADGNQIEWQDQCTLDWLTAEMEDVAKLIENYPQWLRIKPETRSINGVEFAAPDRSGVYTLGGIFPQSWTRKEDRDTAYQAIVYALEGKTK